MFTLITKKTGFLSVTVEKYVAKYAINIEKFIIIEM